MFGSSLVTPNEALACFPVGVTVLAPTAVVTELIHVTECFWTLSVETLCEHSILVVPILMSHDY